MKTKHKIPILAVAMAVAGAFATSAHATPVALELALLVDVSGSVDSTEYALQKTGYVDAFKNATIQANIASLTGGIAVTYIEWSGASQQTTLVNWTHITDATSATAFANAIAGTSRAYSGLTAPGSAINYATPLFTSNTYEGARWVIDVSGDGSQNDGATTTTARDAFLTAGGDAINGLAILGESGLLTWYQNNIKGGTNAFVVAAADFDAFGDAVKSKIGREITGGVPAPGALALLGIGMLGLGLVRRKA